MRQMGLHTVAIVIVLLSASAFGLSPHGSCHRGKQTEELTGTKRQRKSCEMGSLCSLTQTRRTNCQTYELPVACWLLLDLLFFALYLSALHALGLEAYLQLITHEANAMPLAFGDEGKRATRPEFPRASFKPDT